MSIQVFIESDEVARMSPRFWMFVLYVSEVQEYNLELEDLIVIGQIRYVLEDLEGRSSPIHHTTDGSTDFQPLFVKMDQLLYS